MDPGEDRECRRRLVIANGALVQPLWEGLEDVPEPVIEDPHTACRNHEQSLPIR